MPSRTPTHVAQDETGWVFERRHPTLGWVACGDNGVLSPAGPHFQRLGVKGLLELWQFVKEQVERAENAGRHLWAQPTDLSEWSDKRLAWRDIKGAVQETGTMAYGRIIHLGVVGAGARSPLDAWSSPHHLARFAARLPNALDAVGAAPVALHARFEAPSAHARLERQRVLAELPEPSTATARLVFVR